MASACGVSFRALGSQAATGHYMFRASSQSAATRARRHTADSELTLDLNILVPARYERVDPETSNKEVPRNSHQELFLSRGVTHLLADLQTGGRHN
jgi:hypothetical protein